MCIGLLSATAQELPDFTDPHIKAPISKDLSKHSKIKITINDNAEFSIDGVTFAPKQLSIVLRLIVSQQPKIVISAHFISPEAFRHYKKLFKIASAEGIDDFIVQIASKEKPTSQ